VPAQLVAAPAPVDHDRRLSRLAELHTLRDLVAAAAGIVAAGWVRRGWFVYLDERGDRQVAPAPTTRRAQGRPVVAACLVGAVVQAGGGPGAARSQPVQRALELVWHTLDGDPRSPVRWCPAPAVRAAHVAALARWNDAPARTRADVLALLQRTEQRATEEIAHLRPG
jgi:hypothetical protein